ncbi:MAG: NHL repeat-containing protein [Chloroflexi bacterium]|nr:NHL repeat-containing protein [Chloroflexota bacterium]
MTTQSASRAISLGYLKTIGIVNNQPIGRGFANPIDVAFHPDGRIFVLNRGAPTFARIGVINMDEEYLFEFGKHGDTDGQFKLPAGLAMDSDTNLYVTDEFHNRVVVFDSDGKFIKNWGEGGSGEGQLAGPSGIDIDADDNVYIADQNNHRVQKFSNDGRFILAFGGFGDGDGQMNMPWGVDASPDGSVFVADWRNDRIQKYSSDGQFIAAFGGSGLADGQLSRPANVEVDSEGFIYVADWGNERIQIFAPDFTHQATLLGEATLSKWAYDFLAANLDETETRKISNLDPKKLPSQYNTPHLVSSQIEPYFWGPASVNVDSQGRMFVTETSRHRIQIYQKG